MYLAKYKYNSIAIEDTVLCKIAYYVVDEKTFGDTKMR